ncbi:hypothetical protein BHM03_00037268 [Ensete ventricosum]|nr:hypothetical protein BHM03_00037268 [Ensete ventricosum]
MNFTSSEWLSTKDDGPLQTEVPTSAYKTHSYLQAKIGHKANQTRAAKLTISPLLVVQGATGSSISVNNTTARRAMDYMSECHGTTVAGLPCVRIESCIEKPWLSTYGGCVPSRKY